MENGEDQVWPQDPVTWLVYLVPLITFLRIQADSDLFNETPKVQGYLVRITGIGKVLEATFC